MQSREEQASERRKGDSADGRTSSLSWPSILPVVKLRRTLSPTLQPKGMTNEQKCFEPDRWVGIANSATIVGNEVRDDGGLAVEERVAANGSLLGLADLDNAAELVLGLVSVDAVEDESALGVV